MTKITSVTVRDIRFPTSRNLDGSDAMNPDPDYSAAYVVLKTDRPGLEGHGLTFTLGLGTELCVAAAEALAPAVIGHSLADITADMGKFWRALTEFRQLRWVGPEKGVLHLATAAVVNAIWDLWGKAAGKPVWRLVVDMSPEEALAILRANHGTRDIRIAEMEKNGYPAYTTSAGWLGYLDDKVRRLTREAMRQGLDYIKIKVGRDLADDKKRCKAVRDEIGPNRKLMIDANQIWDVAEAIDWVTQLAPYKPLWIEEPTSPDDVLGHAAIRKALKPLGIGV